MARAVMTFTLSAPGVEALQIAVHALSDIAAGESKWGDAERALEALKGIRDLLDGAPIATKL